MIFFLILTLAYNNSGCQEAVYAVMAAREQEEEKTQRTMIALNEMKPFYPGKSSEDVQRVLEEVRIELLLIAIKHLRS